MFSVQHLRSMLLLACLCAAASGAWAQGARPVRVAVLDFGESETGRRASARLAATLAATRDAQTATSISVVDRDLSRAAARGIGYAGSLNLTLREARDLGAAIECDFFVTGEAQTLRRVPSSGSPYYEAYAAIFIVSARTGRLIAWERPSVRAVTPERATEALLEELDRRARARYVASILEARVREAEERRALLSTEGEVFTLEDLSSDEGASAQGNLRAPQPFRRLRPLYPETAASAEVEATVDVLVDLDAGGEVSRVEVSRWAGYGLDEAVLGVIRQMHFRPATRDGAPVPVRVLLRYNFRRPPKTDAPKIDAPKTDGAATPERR